MTFLPWLLQNSVYDPTLVRAAHGTQEELHGNRQVSPRGGKGALSAALSPAEGRGLANV